MMKDYKIIQGDYFHGIQKFKAQVNEALDEGLIVFGPPHIDTKNGVIVQVVVRVG